MAVLFLVLSFELEKQFAFKPMVSLCKKQNLMFQYIEQDQVSNSIQNLLLKCWQLLLNNE